MVWESLREDIAAEFSQIGVNYNQGLRVFRRGQYSPRVCPCGKTFEPASWSEKYCSWECNKRVYIARDGGRKTAACACGVMFEKRGKKYRCDACQIAAGTTGKERYRAKRRLRENARRKAESAASNERHLQLVGKMRELCTRNYQGIDRRARHELLMGRAR